MVAALLVASQPRQGTCRIERRSRSPARNPPLHCALTSFVYRRLLARVNPRKPIGVPRRRPWMIQAELRGCGVTPQRRSPPHRRSYAAAALIAAGRQPLVRRQARGTWSARSAASQASFSPRFARPGLLAPFRLRACALGFPEPREDERRARDSCAPGGGAAVRTRSTTSTRSLKRAERAQQPVERAGGHELVAAAERAAHAVADAAALA